MWEHFRFYMYYRIALQTLDGLFLDFGKMKSIVIVIFFVENFDAKEIKLRIINK